MTGARSFPLFWFEAARFERDRRAQSYPRIVAEGKLAAEAATVDYQAWCAIAEWLACGTARMIGGWGGLADPPVAVISWALLEECAQKAVTSIDRKLAKAVAPDAALELRRFGLDGIHAILVCQRELVERTERDARQHAAAA